MKIAPDSPLVNYMLTLAVYLEVGHIEPANALRSFVSVMLDEMTLTRAKGGQKNQKHWCSPLPNSCEMFLGLLLC